MPAATDAAVRQPGTTGLHLALLVVVAVPLASALFFVSELASVGVTWRGDPSEAYGHEVGDLPAALPRVVSAPLAFVMLFGALAAPLLCLVCLPSSLVLAGEEWRRTRRIAPLTTVTVALSTALLVLVVTWGSELSLWILD